MQLIPMGCGTASSFKANQANFLIYQNGKKMFIDFGTQIRHPMDALGIGWGDIDAIYISHLHSDHCGGIEDVAFATYFTPGCRRKIKLFGNKAVLQRGWNHSWSGGMLSLQGEEEAGLDSYFQVHEVESNGYFVWEGIRFDLVQSIHIMSKFAIIPSYGLMIHVPESTKKIYLTTDQQYAPSQLKDFYAMADLIVQDCETYPFESGVHANIKRLETEPDDVREKMMLTHYGDNFVTKWEEANSITIEHGFKGLCAPLVEIPIP